MKKIILFIKTLLLDLDYVLWDFYHTGEFDVWLFVYRFKVGVPHILCPDNLSIGANKFSNFPTTIRGG